MRQLSLKLLVLVAIVLSPCYLIAQSKSQLEKKRLELSKKITQTSKELEETQKNQEKKKNELATLYTQIQLREELIGTINNELGVLDKSIVTRAKTVSQKQQELQQLKNDYAKAILTAQKRRNVYNELIFVFASADFYQALQRMRYLQEYSAYRRFQAEKIQETQMMLSVELKTLSYKKLEKTSLLGSKEQEKEKLAKDKIQEQRNLDRLQQDEKGLRAELAKQQAEKKKLDDELEKLIAAQIKKAKAANKGSYKLAPAAKVLSDDFAANQGSLPWPVDKGTITGKFGKQAHPVLRNIQIENNGIDISTDKAATVKAIFKGTVSSILVIPGIGKAVVLDHGAYRSIYTQLQEVYVKKGDSITIKQALGKCMIEDGASKSEAHLEIWKVGEDGHERLNPALWISR